ncbi:MAG TPA: ribonuclease HII [Candidatus Paceibacterota bacterium]
MRFMLGVPSTKPSLVLGVDEAGRGPLAGPVAVGVVAVPEGFDVVKEFPGVADSKKLSEKKREKIFKMLETWVAKSGVRFTVEFESAEVIDEEGITIAVRRALWRGVNKLAPDSTLVHVLLDGSLKAPPEYSQETIINGDELVPIISLASIMAKVTRDRLMVELAKKYPQYGFEKHKGYGTALHYEMLKKHGLCDIHRCSYIHLDFKPK